MTHTPRAARALTASLTVTNAAGANTLTAPVTVLSTLKPVAKFGYAPTHGTAPPTVNFTDRSLNSPTSWTWSFGDGSPAASGQTASHTYSAGAWTASLTATNSYGSDTLTVSIAVLP